MRATSRELRCKGKRLGFVPTMGALHEGHLSLVRAAKGRCDAVAVSIFVNPTQFGPKEDFAQYPRPFERDRELLEREGIEFLFAPVTEEMYPAGFVPAGQKDDSTWVEVSGMSERLDGRSRVGHFRGVTTVVSKLFNIVEPDAAFFGQKDAAQAAIIRRMVRDLHFGVEIVVCPIVREADGLAMSSRNVYLSAQERKQALVLSKVLRRVEGSVAAGQTNAGALIAVARAVFATEPEVKVDYIEVVNRDSLEPVDDVSRGALVAVAAYVGTTRLIDSTVIPSR